MKLSSGPAIQTVSIFDRGPAVAASDHRHGETATQRDTLPDTTANASKRMEETGDKPGEWFDD